MIILIEPQWNVDVDKNNHGLDALRILIEPQWNVDYINLGEDDEAMTILIEPQWNVDVVLLTFSNAVSDFNRTIVECRYKLRLIFMNLTSY